MPTSSFTRIKTRWFYALSPYKSCEGMFSLIFPLFLFNVLQASVGMVGVLTALVSLGAVAGAMFWGYISDRFRTRRAFIVLGCLWSGFCLATMAGVVSLTIMAFLCVAFGFFSITPAPISSLLIMETLPRPQWDGAFGTFNKIGGWGWIAGLLMGTWTLPLLNRWVGAGQSMRGALWGLAAMMIATAWWVARTLPQPKRRVRRRQFVAVTHRLPRLSMPERVLYLPRRLLFVLRPLQLLHIRVLVSGPLCRYLAATTIMFVSFIMALTPFPLFLQETHGLEISLIFALVMVRGLACIPFYAWAGRWTPRLGAQRVQMLALAGRCAAFGSLGSLWWITNPGIAFGLLIGISLLVGATWSGIAVAGPVLVGRLATPGRQGEAMGFYNAVQGVAQIVGAILGGYLSQRIGYYSTFMVAGFLLLPAMGLLISLRLQDVPTPAAEPRADPYAA